MLSAKPLSLPQRDMETRKVLLEIRILRNHLRVLGERKALISVETARNRPFTILRLVRNVSDFMDPDGSVLCSQFSTSDPYPATDLLQTLL
jgi:hypothetical protein